MVSIVRIFYLVFYIMVVYLILASSLQANSSSSLLNDANFAAMGSGDQPGSGHYSGSGDDHHGSNDNSTTCHCNGTNLIVSIVAF